MEDFKNECQAQEGLPVNLTGAIERLTIACGRVEDITNKSAILVKVFDRTINDSKKEALLPQKINDPVAKNPIEIINDLSEKIFKETDRTIKNLEYLYVKIE